MILAFLIPLQPVQISRSSIQSIETLTESQIQEFSPEEASETLQRNLLLESDDIENLDQELLEFPEEYKIAKRLGLILSLGSAPYFGFATYGLAIGAQDITYASFGIAGLLLMGSLGTNLVSLSVLLERVILIRELKGVSIPLEHFNAVRALACKCIQNRKPKN